MDLEDAIMRAFTLTNCIGQETNVVERIDKLALSASQIASAITSQNAAGNTDAAGFVVESLTESVMGVTKALMNIGYAMERIASVMERRQ